MSFAVSVYVLMLAAATAGLTVAFARRYRFLRRIRGPYPKRGPRTDDCVRAAH